MQVAVGQHWELPTVGSSDPLVLRVVEVVDGEKAVVHTIRRSDPKAILDRSTMWVRDVISTGVLVSGPGALDAQRRRKRIDHLSALLRYEAKRSGATEAGGDVRFDGHELVTIVAQDEHVPRDQARAMLRDALASLGGREITSAYNPGLIGYVIPSSAIESLDQSKHDS